MNNSAALASSPRSSQLKSDFFPILSIIVFKCFLLGVFVLLNRENTPGHGGPVRIRDGLVSLEVVPLDILGHLPVEGEVQEDHIRLLDTTWINCVFKE